MPLMQVGLGEGGEDETKNTTPFGRGGRPQSGPVGRPDPRVAPFMAVRGEGYMLDRSGSTLGRSSSGPFYIFYFYFFFLISVF